MHKRGCDRNLERDPRDGACAVAGEPAAWNLATSHSGQRLEAPGTRTARLGDHRPGSPCFRMGNNAECSLDLRFRFLPFHFATKHSPVRAGLSRCGHQRCLDAASDSVDWCDFFDHRSCAESGVVAPALVDDRIHGGINCPSGSSPKSKRRSDDFLGPARPPWSL